MNFLVRMPSHQVLTLRAARRLDGVAHRALHDLQLELQLDQASPSLNPISRGRVSIVSDDVPFGKQPFRDLKPCLGHSVQCGDVLAARTLGHFDALVGELLALRCCQAQISLPTVVSNSSQLGHWKVVRS